MRIEKNILINAPAELVFIFLVHPDYLKRWIASMQNFRYTSEINPDDLTGATFEYVGGGNHFRGTVNIYNSPTEYGAFFESRHYDYQDTFVLTPEGSGTRLTGISPNPCFARLNSPSTSMGARS